MTQTRNTFVPKVVLTRACSLGSPRGIPTGNCAFPSLNFEASTQKEKKSRVFDHQKTGENNNNNKKGNGKPNVLQHPPPSLEVTGDFYLPGYWKVNVLTCETDGRQLPKYSPISPRGFTYETPKIGNRCRGKEKKRRKLSEGGGGERQGLAFEQA